MDDTKEDEWRKRTSQKKHLRTKYFRPNALVSGRRSVSKAFGDGLQINKNVPLLFPNRSCNTVGGVQVRVINACQIDGLLTCIQLQLKDDDTFSTESSHFRQFFKAIADARDQASLCQARAEFLWQSSEKIAGCVNMSRKEILINMYGNDVDVISALFGPLMEMTCSNVCKNPNCNFHQTWTTQTPLSLVEMK